MIALDFGTRTVICCEYDDENVTRVGITEHQSRAMREGAVTDMQSAVESLTRIHKKMGLSKDVATTFAIAGSQLIVRKLEITIESHGPWSETQLQNIESDKFEEHFHSERDSDLVPLGVIRTSCTVDGRRVSNVVGMAGERCHYCALVTLLPVRNITSKMKAVEQ
ncbi:MAG: hypothetical protein JKX97_08890, partial [Candidatus Lindowbacteria bacterium]|nr:hypothetical protein [Candidatus Lindowbacteria bacterium]